MSDTPTETTIPKGPVPTDAELLNKRRTEKAREARAAQRANEEPKKKADKKDDPKPEKERAGEKLSVAILRAGCKQLVAVFWWISRGLAWMGGGKLRPLTDAELDDGAREAEALVQRFPIIAMVLAFAGFPLWLIGKVTSLWEPATPKPAEGLPTPALDKTAKIVQPLRSVP